jgi:hypothetical protein
MVFSGRRGSVTFWAWMSSIAVHLIVLTAFGVVKFSQLKAGGEQVFVPTAKMGLVKRLIEAEPVIPKPKIKSPRQRRFLGAKERLLPANKIFNSTRPFFQDWPCSVEPSNSEGVFALSSSVGLPEGIEFFGSFTDQRKVCYLVDCSGSMRGIFGGVRRKLKESIKQFQPDQYFYIIFFGGDRLFESGDGQLVRATPDAKSRAVDFIDSIGPAGQTNALGALERAVKIRDRSGRAPLVIYFLTDGFELTTEDTQAFGQKVTNLMKRFAPATRVNTIGFWPQTQDRRMLEAIARNSGGEFVIIDDDGIF